MRPDGFDGVGGRKAQAIYYAMIEQLDEQIGRLLGALDETGQRDNTVIIFTSDHGEALGDHGLAHKGCRFFDGLTRVPLLWSWPSRFVSGLRSDALVGLLDIAPTLLELAGLPIPERMQGRSLLPILTDEAAPDHHRDFVFGEYYDAVDLPGRSFATMYRDRRWKLVVYQDRGLGERYDMETDPDEFESRWDDPSYQAVKTDLLVRSFDATVRAMEYRPSRITPF